MKQVWENRATWSRTASTTAGAAWPTLTTAMPAPRSISELPSTSTRMAPDASLDVHGQDRAHPGGHRGRPAPRQRLRFRARELGDQVPLLFDEGRHHADSSGRSRRSLTAPSRRRPGR